MPRVQGAQGLRIIMRLKIYLLLSSHGDGFLGDGRERGERKGFI